MTNGENIQTISKELETGIQLAKCQKCGCMRDTLDDLTTTLPTIGTDKALPLLRRVEAWGNQMQPIQYACLGCEYCYPAFVQNAFSKVFPSVVQSPALSCDFRVNEKGWPPVAGEYFVVDRSAPVAVSTLASVQLPEKLAWRKPKALAIVGKTETENIGIDKVIKNIITNPSIRYLLIVGSDPVGHLPGRTLLELSQNGIDNGRRVIGSPGKRPVLRNVSTEEIEAFNRQVRVIDMVGSDNPDEIGAEIEKLSHKIYVTCGCSECSDESPSAPLSTVPKIAASAPDEAVKLDKAGYFVIIPLTEKGVISVEHYAYDNTLQRVVEGENARELNATIIANGWVTELSHAAYLGKELARAELSMQLGFKYVQDGA